MTCPIEQENIELKKRLAERDEELRNLTEQVREMLVDVKAKPVTPKKS